ncbi:MAG: tryptophan synthase subunit alpha [Candidatus Omnitrophota bacterium]|jgi:tryptophan synthase alpha chain|nr:MAG: tryptophan synthase subunit alpha [Candidatus Omnitrophota bacterium]
MNRIEKTFRELKKSKKKAFIAFITAGYPSLSITKKLVRAFAESGVDIIELGVPFSDPIADGPLIQEASVAALKNKVTLKAILHTVKQLRNDVAIPLCLMSYYNPIFCFGETAFIEQAHAAGVDGVLIPDLPFEEARTLAVAALRVGVDIIPFISPTSSPARSKAIASSAKGFIYYISLEGITGPRTSMVADLARRVRQIKHITTKPVCVGFGISVPSQVRQVYRVADGVIVGSAIIKKIKESLSYSDMIQRVAAFVRELKDA